MHVQISISEKQNAQTINLLVINYINETHNIYYIHQQKKIMYYTQQIWKNKI